MLEEGIDKANMRFEVQLLEYVGDDSWVGGAVESLKACLASDECPEHAAEGFGPKGDKQCEYATLFDGMKENNLN